MSEHTLDDLAALERELSELGAIVLRARTGHWVEFSVQGTFTAFVDRTISGEGPKLGGNLMAIYAVIRQWQAIAEPAPPPAAPVVISGEMVERGALAIWEHAFPGKTWDVGLREIYRADARLALDAALRGAHLAPEPEGARDGQ